MGDREGWREEGIGKKEKTKKENKVNYINT